MKTVIVAGITRSGLTMTMQMLNAGGFQCLGEYPAFEDVDLSDIVWKDVQGKAVKLVDTHHCFPPTGDYKVIRLHRNYKQQAKSQVKFLKLMCGIPATSQDRKNIEKGLSKDYKKIDSWKKRQSEYLDIHFEDIIKDPYSSANKINKFLNAKLNIKLMAHTVIKRNPDCYDGLLEATMI